MEPIRIEQCTTDRLPQLPDLIGPLVADSRQSGFRMLERLVADWQDQSNRFDQPGEVLLVALNSDHEVVGIGGLNCDPDGRSGILRVRRVYILSDLRRMGIGNQLMTALMTLAKQTDSKWLELRATTDEAFAFYEKHGFERYPTSGTTHRLALR